VQSGNSLWFLGYPDRAAVRIASALQLAPSVAHALSTAQTLAFASLFFVLRRESTRGLELADELVRFAQDHGLPLWRANGQVLRGWALSEMGRPEAVDVLRAAIQQRQAAGGGRARVALQLATLAQALARVEAAEAQTVIEDAVREVEATNERWYEPFVHWVKGQVYAARPLQDRGRAAACYAQACEIARRQGAKSMELRAATSLAELWAEEGRRHDARALLAPIYEWFTEGFDTPDLKDAAALLAKLR
jgi:adenylate cyclase